MPDSAQSSATRRSQAKSDRRNQLITAAERLVAERGFLAVRLEDIGAAVGVSGPAIYRHFPNKEALLVELLVGISTRLLAGAQAVVDAAGDPAVALEELIDFHLDFALGEPDLIRIQDRDLGHLPDPARRQVRRAQRKYVELWTAVLQQMNRAPARSEVALSEADARLMAHGAFGLMNSTPYIVKPGGTKIAEASYRTVLREMTVAALTSAGRLTS